ncbi:Growth factor receptor-bound protein 14 [Taenia crassiceps]|uniref:Growth factor receptor-bound protein 14 n=1 Tax=Taenia crassiceps TaxID=6207 RepID=A0ABR4Q7V2_9CEST
MPFPGDLAASEVSQIALDIAFTIIITMGGSRSVNKSGPVSTKRCPLFHHTDSGVWSVFDRNLEQECKESDGKLIMKIHNEDHTYKTVLINDGMRVGEVCGIMLGKNHRDDLIVHWQMFEEPGDCPGFERPIEDHEFAIDVQRRWPAAVAPSRIWFRYNPRKYNFSDNQEHLIRRTDAFLSRNTIYKSLSFPGISEGVVLLKRPQTKWTKVFCFLIMSAIFFTKKTFNVSKKKAKYLLDLTSMDVYVPKLETDASSMLNTPTPHTLLLVPSSIGLLDPEAIFAIGVKTRECMLGWAEGLRFYKHGQRRLLENLEAALRDRYHHKNQTIEQNGLNEEHIYSQIQQDTSSLYQQNRPLKPVEYTIDATPSDGTSSTLGRWGNSHQELSGGEFPVRSMIALPPKTSNGVAPWPRNPNQNSSIYVAADEFEGIVFRSGVPFLHLNLPDGIHKFPIEVRSNCGFEEKRYKLTFRSERFATLNDLSQFYEDRRHLLAGYNGFRSIELPHLRTDSATAL